MKRVCTVYLCDFAPLSCAQHIPLPGSSTVRGSHRTLYVTCVSTPISPSDLALVPGGIVRMHRRWPFWPGHLVHVRRLERLCPSTLIYQSPGA
jgi:hypothetical protein